MSYRGEMGEGASNRSQMGPHARVRCLSGLSTDEKTSPKWAWKGLSDLSTIFNGSTCNRKGDSFSDRGHVTPPLKPLVEPKE